MVPHPTCHSQAQTRQLERGKEGGWSWEVPWQWEGVAAGMTGSEDAGSRVGSW